MSRIRVATPADAGAFLEIYAPVVRDTPISFEIEPPSASELAERVRATLVDRPWLVLEGEEGAVGGYAYATAFRSRPAYRWCAEVSVYVRESHRGRGVGEALYRALLDALGAQGFRSAVAAVTLPNPASVALHERLGFEAVGVFRRVGYKFGRWHDVGWWQRSLGHGEEPPPPVPFPRLVEEGWRPPDPILPASRG